MSCLPFACFYALALLAYAPFVASQDPTDLPSTWPHFYPGQPSGDYSPEWQSYFEVTQKLPNITWKRKGVSLETFQYNGRPPKQYPFFLGFEKSQGSLTAPLSPSNQQPWGIWLNGGMYGMFFENGPIQLQSDYSAKPNPYSWNNLADYFWIDQPVGVGYSTSDATGYAPDEDQIGKDFMGFLSNLVKVFPSLATRPLHITGESYAGQYIPYILKAYFDMPNPPVKVAKIAMGDGTYSSEQIFELLPALSVLTTYPQIIGYDQDVYNYFKEQTDLCGFNITLTYPQHGTIPDVNFTFPTQRFIPWQQKLKRKSFRTELTRRIADESSSISLRKREDREYEKEIWKRDLSLRANGTIDPWYGCFLLDMFIDYALNYTFPWNLTDQPGLSFNVYDIPDALNPKVTRDASVFMNDPRVRAAFHAPTVKDWEMQFDFPFGADPNDGSPMSINIFNDLAANATKKGVGIMLFSGNDDALIPHRGTELAIQNTTFGGIQGFTRKPSTPWSNDAGKLAGVVHQERGWQYVLFLNAGHLVGQDAPISAFTFMREFVLGNNPTGSLVTSRTGAVSVVGGENQSLSGIIPGPDPIYYGNGGGGATQSTYLFPAATRSAWKTFIAHAEPTYFKRDAN
ncbi:Alpha/Beta hydrolase protein [Pholiota molesta]|nr:Alpha/Beta hydrolase protein [Pholiota molesta]